MTTKRLAYTVEVSGDGDIWQIVDEGTEPLLPEHNGDMEETAETIARVTMSESDPAPGTFYRVTVHSGATTATWEDRA